MTSTMKITQPPLLSYQVGGFCLQWIALWWGSGIPAQPVCDVPAEVTMGTSRWGLSSCSPHPPALFFHQPGRRVSPLPTALPPCAVTFDNMFTNMKGEFFFILISEPNTIPDLKKALNVCLLNDFFDY